MVTVDIDSLTIDERLDLIERLWASLSPEANDMSPQWRAEVMRRSGTVEARTAQLIPWDQVRRELGLDRAQ